jgi:hypothetical protein
MAIDDSAPHPRLAAKAKKNGMPYDHRVLRHRGSTLVDIHAAGPVRMRRPIGLASPKTLRANNSFTMATGSDS